MHSSCCVEGMGIYHTHSLSSVTSGDTTDIHILPGTHIIRHHLIFYGATWAGPDSVHPLSPDFSVASLINSRSGREQELSLLEIM